MKKIIFLIFLILLNCEQKQPFLPYFLPLSQIDQKESVEPESVEEIEDEEPTEEPEPTPPWYKPGWVYVLGNQDQIIYEAEIDEWNIEGFKMQAELMNHFKDPNCPCKAVWFPL